MEVLVWLSWHVVVNDHIDLFNINTSSEKIGRHQDSIFVLFELSVDSQSVLDLHGRVAGSTWEPSVTDDLVKFFGVFLSFHKDDNLVEVQIIEELDELLDFLVFLKSHVELLQTEEGEIFLLINENLLWVLHVHSADILSLRRHGGWEHHDLSVGVSSHEDLLNLGSHVCFVQHLIAFVQNEDLEVVQFESLFLDQSKDSSWGTNDNMRALFFIFEEFLVILYWDSTEDDGAS